MNPYCGQGSTAFADNVPLPISDDVDSVLSLLNACPVATQTPLVSVNTLAEKTGVAKIHFKDERARMGLGSFKALGASYVIAKAAVAANDGVVGSFDEMKTALSDKVFVAASAGNHGLSVAAGARVFGARAIIYLSKTVPTNFAERLRGYGADVVIAGDDYEASMAAALKAANDNGWTLLSDTTWTEYSGGRDVMEGYLAMVAEVADKLEQAPTHIFLQAGVGGLAAAVTVEARNRWGDAPIICVVEPTAAPALQASIAAGKLIETPGPVSNMGRLDCKEPSLIALECLSRQANAFMTLDDDYVASTIAQLEEHDLATSPSGGAGFAGLIAAANDADNSLKIDNNSRILLFISEGPADD